MNSGFTETLNAYAVTGSEERFFSQQIYSVHINFDSKRHLFLWQTFLKALLADMGI